MKGGDCVLKEKEYIQMSLELNQFFTRIMKEHMIFMEISLPIKNSDYILEAETLKRSFEEVLREIVDLSRGILDKEVLNSNQFVTPYTLDAEIKVEELFGVCIDKNITKSQLELTPYENSNLSYNMEKYVYELNNRIINLLMDIIQFKENVLARVLNCEVAMSIYPDMLDHLIRESKFYLKLLLDIQERMASNKGILNKKIFWDHIMEEHALYIRGLLDPSEEELIKKANDFAKLFEDLLKKAKKADKKDACQISRKNLDATKDLMAFKVDATEGLLQCQIKSITNPLLGDHVLREANRFIWILKKYLKGCK